MLSWVVAVWISLLGGYIFLAGSIDATEVVAGAVCASMGTALTYGLSAVAEHRFAVASPSKAIARPLAALIPETIAVGRQMLAAIVSREDRRGAFVRQPFEPGSDNDSFDYSRRALVIIGVSLAPRAFVIRGETGDTLLLHSLPDKPASPDQVWPA